MAGLGNVAVAANYSLAADHGLNSLLRNYYPSFPPRKQKKKRKERRIIGLTYPTPCGNV